MKKISLAFLALLLCVTGFAQTFTTTSTTINSGDSFTITGVGETLSHYFLAEQSQQVWYVANPAYISNQSIQFVAATYYNTTTHTPTSLTFKATNTASVPVQVTYRIRVMPYDGVNLTTLADVNTDVTLTVNPAPQQTGTFAKLVEIYTGTPGNAQYNVWVKFYSDPQGQHEITTTLPASIPVIWSHDSVGRQGPVTTTTTTTVNQSTLLASGAAFTQAGQPLPPPSTPTDYHLLPSGSNYIVIN